jgi:hypothetical protein
MSRKWKRKAPRIEPPTWTFSPEMMTGFYIISVSRNEKCYAEKYLKENPPIFNKFEFLKGRFK